MELLILGATGKVGSELVKQALERGFEVTALVRSPHKVKIEDDSLFDAYLSRWEFSNENSSLSHATRIERFSRNGEGGQTR